MDELIIETLKPLNMPVRKQYYTGKEIPYITFFKILEQGELFASDKERVTGYYYQINIFGLNNLNRLEKQVIDLMKQKGFIRKGSWDGPYEMDTKLYNKVLRFYKGKDIA